ncbi:(2Fe-2S)-binding protein [Marinobacter sp.]|uniref:(2Fe-2S)-binding protein n=1 Tax=Marinobacter sp. TaxID=50741 RepID=UPI002B460582|nr:(2Fe-2S)-binding protein [Marinobacter sp.]HKK56097.1 (2Fe-2S)-binding protein [Marinobacter sp.]
MAAPEPTFRNSTWIDHYDRLLKASGLDREAVLAGALPRDRNRRHACLSLAQCLRQPSLLVDQVYRDYPDARTPKALTARLSVLQQDLALSVIAPLTLRLFLDRQAATPDPERICLASLACTGSPGSPEASASMRWYQEPGGTTVDETAFIRSLGQQTRDWYPVFRHSLNVSPGAYWSSVGLGLSAPFSAVWNRAAPEALCELAQHWLEAFDNSARQFINWIPAVFAGQTTAVPQRKGCCLKYLLPEGGYCGTCGIYRKERLTALRHQQPQPERWQPGR